ncbi:MAG: SBBP repeat-containing protein [Candidatus Binataceae bacterium]
MIRGSKLIAVAAAGLAVGLDACIAMAQPSAPTHAASAATRARVVANYGKLPISFEPNVGQVAGGAGASDVKFLSRGNGYTLFLDPHESIVRLRREATSAHKQVGVKQLAARPAKGGASVTSEVVDMKLVGARPAPQAVGLEELPGKVNYFRGRDPKNWHADIPTYAKVKLEQVYPGIDLVYYGNQQQLEYDFVVQPGADPRAIRMDVAGLSAGKGAHAVAPRIDRNGDLVLAADNSEVRFHKPVVYQPDGVSARKPVDGNFKLDKGQVTFQVASYDRGKPLVIDPVLGYSTYINNTAVDETSAGIAVDSSGNAYVASETDTTDFPTTLGAYQANHASGDDSDATVFKLNPSGTALVYATYLGGTGEDSGEAITVDAAGEAIVVGYTCSLDFPVTAGAFQTTPNANLAECNGENMFLTKFSASGSSLIGSTYLGGSVSDIAYAAALDPSGNVYVTGFSCSPDFPVTPGVIEPTFGGSVSDGTCDGVVAKLNPTLTALTYSTYLGGASDGSLSGIAVDAAGDAYVAGYTLASGFPVTPGAFQTTFVGNGANQAYDTIVAKLNPTATALLYGTYISAGDDAAYAVAIDKAGDAYITGDAAESNFPVTPGAYQTVYGGAGVNGVGDVFVSKLNPSGSALIYSTYIGGAEDDSGYGITVDRFGGAWVVGATDSSNFPVTRNAIQSAYAGPDISGAGTTFFYGDLFVLRLNAKGSALSFSSYLGGSGDDEPGYNIVLYPSTAIYIAGTTTSTDFPTTSGAFNATCSGDYCGDYQNFITKIIPGSTDNAASRRARPKATGNHADLRDLQAADPDAGERRGPHRN